MAKRIVKWTLDGNVLKLSKVLEDPKAEAVVEAEFDLAKLFPNIGDMTEVQKQCIAYGVKQKLMDTGASEVSDGQSKIQAAKDTWKDILEGKWKGERINATGAAENKRIAAQAKDLAKTFTLQGLMAKKYVLGQTLTEDEEAKLQEFILEAAKTDRKPKK